MCFVTQKCQCGFPRLFCKRREPRAGILVVQNQQESYMHQFHYCYSRRLASGLIFHIFFQNLHFQLFTINWQTQKVLCVALWWCWKVQDGGEGMIVSIILQIYHSIALTCSNGACAIFYLYRRDCKLLSSGVLNEKFQIDRPRSKCAITSRVSDSFFCLLTYWLLYC